MAKIVFIGLEPAAATQIRGALADGQHQIEHKPGTTEADDIIDADIVFADGAGKRYMPLLRNLRQTNPELPFVVVTRIPETTDWLDALEAGATDYCSAPFEQRQISWVMESVLRRPRTIAA